MCKVAAPWYHKQHDATITITDTIINSKKKGIGIKTPILNMLKPIPFIHFTSCTLYAVSPLFPSLFSFYMMECKYREKKVHEKKVKKANVQKSRYQEHIEFYRKWSALQEFLNDSLYMMRTVCI